MTYKLTVGVTGTDKGPAAFKDKRVLCEPSAQSSVLKWDKDGAKWVADESAIGMISETAYCREP